MMAGANAGKAIVAAAGGEEWTHAALPRGWRAAEALRTILPARLRGALAGLFVTEASVAAAAESMP
jgi:hypothetical protein|tara:strand:+ start:94 stop:291 length:198 start_codon:yes stop_codon:yes gene_type:complete